MERGNHVKKFNEFLVTPGDFIANKVAIIYFVVASIQKANHMQVFLISPNFTGLWNI